jgi:F-type H+-transporting ATPase subunit gamma
MPSLKDIRRRIGSVKNTQKITRAMKLVAAAKLRRAQDSIVRARPYAHKLHGVVRELALRSEPAAHPLLARRPDRNVLLIVLSSNRGLCGAFNTNVLRAAEAYRQQHRDAHERLELSVVGRKGKAYYAYRHIEMAQTLDGVETATAPDRARQLSEMILARYTEATLDRVLVVYNEFKSAMSQRVRVEQLLPIEPLELRAPDGEAIDFAYEPSKAAVLAQVLPMFVRIELQRTLLETTAAEFGARMTAMENATNNASEMVNNLTLEYNKARQASITKELLEIVAGAEAL